MTRLVETLQNMLDTTERTFSELGESDEWFRGYKAGLEASIRAIRMSLRIAAEMDGQVRATEACRITDVSVLYQVLGNLKDREKRAPRGRHGLVDMNGLFVGDIVHVYYRHGLLFVDETGNYTWLVTDDTVLSPGIVKLVRLHFDALKNWGKASKGRERSG